MPDSIALVENVCPYGIITLNPKALKIEGLRVWRYSFPFFFQTSKQNGAGFSSLKS